MAGLPVTIRLLDPPLHEFLPHSEEEIAEVARPPWSRRAARAARSRWRSCTNSTRCSAIAAAAWRSPIPKSPRCRRAPSSRRRSRRRRDAASRSTPEIMVPLVAVEDRARHRARRIIDEVARRRLRRRPARRCEYLVGTMIELPRAALRAGDIAETAEFFSFGTNDLTQTTFGISRDDAARFLGDYTAKGVIEVDPFVTLDHGRRRRAGADRGASAAARRGPTSSSASAASMAATRPRSASANGSGSTTSPARRSACRLRGWRRRRPRSSHAPADRQGPSRSEFHGVRSAYSRPAHLR